jgi:uncharacterized repeat protein (TIGR01451 family)
MTSRRAVVLVATWLTALMPIALGGVAANAALAGPKVGTSSAATSPAADPHPPLQTCTPAQVRATERYWFPGSMGAFDFGVSGTTLTTSTQAQTTQEGSTVVTDTHGQLLFWSNGQTVYDRTGAVMANGSGLLGDLSATQGIVAFPSIGHPGVYFTVTTSANAVALGGPNPGTLAYSKVDMSLNGGLGAVTATKNVPLGSAGTASEAITAVPNDTGTGFWVLTYTMGSPNILAYAFDANGPVTGTPVVTTLPTGNPIGFGALSASPDLSQIVEIAGSTGGVHLPGKLRLLSLDAQTGAFTQRAEWDMDTTHADLAYYADFSPSGRYVYATRLYDTGALYRYDVSDPTASAIKASEQYVGSVDTVGGAVRRGADGRMYIANAPDITHPVTNAMSVVTDPDSASAPGLLTGGLSMPAGATSTFGLAQTVTGCAQPQPIVTGTKVVSNLTDPGQPAQPGDVLQYTIDYSNAPGGGPSDQFAIVDHIPAGTAYQPGSLSVVSGPTAGPRTDAAGDDTAEYDGSGPLVAFRVGTGATPAAGGTVGPGESVSVRFRVTVDPTVPATISNTATASWHSPTIGDSYHADTPPSTIAAHPASAAEPAPPVVTILSPVAGGEVPQGTSLTALFSCDSPAGVASCAGTYPEGSSIDTSRPGIYTFTVTVVDKLGRTVTKTITFTVKAAAKPPAHRPKTADELAVECSGAQLVLLDVRRAGDRARLKGTTVAANAGREVAIRLLGAGKVVAHAKVQSDGSFATTAALPPRAIRMTNRGRYRAELGGEKSAALKLVRRIDVTGLEARGGRITISGRVSWPLAHPIRKVFVRQHTVCGGKGKFVATVRPAASGRFRVSIPRPRGVDAAIYRLQTRVRKQGRSRPHRKTFATYTLLRGVNLF